jgi:acyl-CoA thioesterase
VVEEKAGMKLPDSQAALDTLAAVESDGPNRARVVFPDDWQQGRGIFGGLIAAVVTRALEAGVPERVLRSLSLQICGPVQPGEATLLLDVLRAGNAVTTAAVKLVQGGEVQAHGVGVLGRDRTHEQDSVELTAPAMPGWRDIPPAPVGAPLGPAFARFFEFRPTGPLPFSGSEVAAAEGWIRPKNPGQRRDAAFLAACVDAYWPALFARASAPRPMATIAFTLQPFVHFDGLSVDAPLFYRARLLATDGGYFVENRELWGEDGRLLALNQQTFAIIK